MKTNIQRIDIYGLHGRLNIKVPIKDNILILVGENGSSKTTFLRILYIIMSGKWLDLLQYKFERIEATINDIHFKITPGDLTRTIKNLDRRSLFELPISLRRRVSEILEKGDLEKAYIELERFAIRHDLPADAFIRQIESFDTNKGGEKSNLKEYISKIKTLIDSQVLYLPTYRRIERELGSIFEGADTEEFKRFRSRIRQNEFSDNYIELVEFGMNDVQQAIDKTLSRLKDFARESLNNLTLRYLGDVVNREYEKVGLEDISSISDDTIKNVLNRINDTVLLSAHREHIASVIYDSRTATPRTEHQKIISHYFMQLMNFQKSLNQNEHQITEFCNLCSHYISDKYFEYDSYNFGFSISHKENKRNFEPKDADKKLDLSGLSSGEKQIISLFSHLYLSGKNKFVVLIDEPELSLSVPWQKRFLVDIKEGKFCNGLFAVTHSPFIYDNDLNRYAHSIGEFTSHA